MCIFLVLFSVALLLTSRFLCYVMYCQEYAAAGTVKQNYVNILLMLLRLRQACDHPLLVRGYKSSSTWKSSVEVAKKLPQEKRVCLLKCLEDSFAICGICNVCVHLLVVFWMFQTYHLLLSISYKNLSKHLLIKISGHRIRADGSSYSYTREWPA